jgi:hypothetical protein
MRTKKTTEAISVPVTEEIVAFNIEDLDTISDNTRKPKKKKNYINNADLLKELEISNTKGKMTNELTKMLMMLTHRFAMKGRFANYTYNEDMQAFALFTIVRVWHKFDSTKSNNPFAYFTQTIKNAFFQYDNTERAQRDVKDKIRITQGEAPSFSFLDRNGHDDFDSNLSSSDSVELLYSSTDHFDDSQGVTPDEEA